MKNKKRILMALIVTIALAFTACGTAVNDTQKETDQTSKSNATSTVDTDKKSDKKADTKDEKKTDKSDSKKDAADKKASDDKKTAETNKTSDSKSSNDAKQPASEKNNQTEKPSSGHSDSGNQDSNQTPSNDGNHNSDTGNSGNSDAGNSGNNGNSGSNPSEPSHSHNYTSSVTVQPTCSANGNRAYTCSCGASYNESLSATDHNWQYHDATGQNESVLVSAAWDEPTYENHVLCNQCNMDFGTDVDAAGDHVLFTDCENYRTESVQTGSVHHDAVYETQWKETSAAYSDCSTCGKRQ